MKINKSIFYRKHHPSIGKHLSKNYSPLPHIGIEHRGEYPKVILFSHTVIQVLN